MKTVRLPASITIFRPFCNTGEQYVSIEIIDEVSTCPLCYVRIALDDYAKVMTGQARIKCNMDYYEDAPIGKQLETKTEKVIVKGHISDGEKYDKEVEKALKPFEKDGWKGYRSDARNPHRGQPKTGMSVSFHRHVKADPKEVEKKVKKVEKKILPPEDVAAWMHGYDEDDES